MYYVLFVTGVIFAWNYSTFGSMGVFGILAVQEKFSTLESVSCFPFISDRSFPVGLLLVTVNTFSFILSWSDGHFILHHKVEFMIQILTQNLL